MTQRTTEVFMSLRLRMLMARLEWIARERARLTAKYAAHDARKKEST